MKVFKQQKSSFIALFVLLMLSSCFEQNLFDPSGGPLAKGNVELTMQLKTPGGFGSETKGLTESQESNIHDILVFAFRNGTLSYVKEGKEITNSGSEKSFKVELKASDNPSETYQLMVLANSKAAVATVLGAGLDGLNNQSYDQVQAALKTTETDKMCLDRGSIIMWGETKYLEVTSTKPIPSIQLLRSIARIDVGLNGTYSGNTVTWGTLPNFKLAQVLVYRYNTDYSLVPLTGKRTAENNKVTDHSAISSSKTAVSQKLTYTANSSSNTSVRDIYVAESDIKMTPTGSSGDANHAERMALVVGGYYDNAPNLSYYRLDFIGKEKSLLNVLRNHWYRFNIQRVSGSGYSTPDEAYNSQAINMSVEVLQWDDAGMEDIVFDGQHYISMDNKQVAFDQTGNAKLSNTITLKTNGGALTIGEGFTATASANVYEDASKHFTITVTGTNEGDQKESIYTLTLSAKPSTPSDSEVRNATAELRVKNLKINLELRQDPYESSFLETTPASGSIVSLNEEEQVMKISIKSGLPYSITSDNLTMFTGYYTDELALSPIENTNNIPATTQEVFVKVSATTVDGSRYGNLYIKHIDPNSTSEKSTINVKQSKNFFSVKSITTSTTFNHRGGRALLDVSTSLDSWTASLIDNGDSFASLSTTTGTTGTTRVHVNIAAVPSNWYPLMPIPITVRFSGGGQTKDITLDIKWTTISGVPGVLSITKDGELTLDAELGDDNASALYFKFGSIIGISSYRNYSGNYHGLSQVLYKPKLTGGYRPDYMYWTDIKIQEGLYYPTQTKENFEKGLGDPCRLVGLKQADFDNGVFDNLTWKTPTNEENTKVVTIGEYIAVRTPESYAANGTSYPGYWITEPSIEGRSFFLPPLGRRDETGIVSAQYGKANYWSTTVGEASFTHYGYSLTFTNIPVPITVTKACKKHYALPIRCVKQ